VLWALLLPFSLWQRYRLGRARRSAQGWVVRANAWLLAASVPMFLIAAWISGRWMPQALRDAVLGLGAGVLIGIASLWLTHFERVDGRLFYTPNRWLVLALTSLVATRIAFGLWSAWQARDVETASSFVLWLQTGGVLAVGGVLVGYYLAYTWGLRARMSRPMA
jgi:hypothetical protein